MPVSPGRKESTATLLARVSPDDVLLFANQALADYVGMAKSELIGLSLEQLRGRMGGELAEFFARESQFHRSHQLVVDPAGRVFEACRNVRGAMLDFLATEVPPAGDMISSFQASVPFSSADLSPEEIRSVLQPERRLVSLSRTRLIGLEDFAADAPPGEVRLLLLIFAEEMREAIWEAGSSVGVVSPGEIEGIYGLPRYFQDHSLRALRAVFSQFHRFAALRTRLHRLGHDVPPLSAGIAGGEVLLTPLPDPSGNRLAATGPAARLAQYLAEIAPPGEIYISQFALSSLLAQLPEGWSSLRAQIDDGTSEPTALPQDSRVQPLPDSLRSHVYLVGPDVQNHPEQSAFYFPYLFTVQMPGFPAPVPVLRAVQPEDSLGSTGGIELSENRILSAPAAMVLGKYKLLEVVGQGGMGKVWRGQDPFGNQVAIKVLNSAETASEDTVRRFQREAEVMARLSHRNICRVFEIGQVEEIKFLVMEFVEGVTLADLLYEDLEADPPGGWRDTPLPEIIRHLRQARQAHLQEGRQPIAETGARPEVNRILPFGQTLALFAKICEGVQFAHEQGILHRDLKPGNVLLRVDGEPLVADFGLAKLEEENEQSLSLSGHVVGTIENMSPEQAESSKDVDERADVYSLGTILYQMLTGHRHFQASGHIFADAAALKHHQPIRPRQWNPRIEPDLELIVLKALRPNRLERYRTVSALQADLNRYRRGESVKARPVSVLDLARKVAQKHAPMAAVLLLAFLALTFGGIFGFLHVNERRKELEETLAKLEQALATADQHSRLSEMARVEAEQQRETAELRQREAERALAEAREARRAAEAAEQEKDIARQESAEHLEARARYEETARSLQERLDELERSASPEGDQMDLAAAGEAPSPEAAAVAASNNPFRDNAEVYLQEARRIFHEELSPFLLGLSGGSEEKSSLLLRGLDAAATAAAIAPEMAEAWLYKGHFHLAMREYPAAALAYAEGRRILEEELSDAESASDWQISLREFSDHWPAPQEERFASPMWSVQTLQKMASRDALVLVELLRRSGSPTLERETSVGERLLELRTRNAEFAGHLSWVTGMDGDVLLIIGASGIRDWSPLRDLPVRELFVSEAREFDWNLPATWSLQKLHLNAATLTSWPPRGERSLAGLTVADFSGTPLPHGVAFLSEAGGLQSLNLAGTGITDIAPITGRSLRSIDLTGTRVQNVLHLMRFPLESLTLDSTVVASAPNFAFLRSHRTLRYLRTERDPRDQTVAEFWQKWDAGFYKEPPAAGGVVGEEDW